MATPKGTFYIREDRNSMVNVDQFPFVVGETFNFARIDNNGSKSVLSATATIAEINASSAADDGNGLIEIKTDTVLTNNTGVNISQVWAMYSTAVCDASTYDCSYEVSNVNLIVSQVILDPAYEAGMMRKVQEGKAIEFDIMSTTNYKHSILATDRQTTFQIFAQNSRAKSLLVVPQDSTVYTSAQQISGSGTYVIVGTDSTVNSSTDKQVNQDICITNTRSGS